MLTCAHWHFGQNFFSTHYPRMPREVMGVKRSRMQVGLGIFTLVPLIFSVNAENLKNVPKNSLFGALLSYLAFEVFLTFTFIE